MVTTEKLTFIQETLERGDIADIARTLNINYIYAYDVLNGKIKKGAHGKAIIRAAMKIITKRIKQIEKDKQQFGVISNPIP